MANMLLRCAAKDRGKHFWYCCDGHDAWNRKTRRVRKRIMRRKENERLRKQTQFEEIE